MIIFQAIFYTLLVFWASFITYYIIRSIINDINNFKKEFQNEKK